MKNQNTISWRLFAACASAWFFASSAAAQNVGIGVSNPQSKLTVNGTTASGGIAVGDGTYNVAAPTNGAIIEGHVGIGTTTPAANLHAFNSGSTLVDIESGAAGGTVPQLHIQNDSTTSLQSFITMTNGAGNKGFALAVDEAGNNRNSFSIQDEAAGATTRFLIDPNGNAGVGSGLSFCSSSAVYIYDSVAIAFAQNRQPVPQGRALCYQFFIGVSWIFALCPGQRLPK